MLNMSPEASAIYTYRLVGMTPSRKVLFVYALKGRGKERGLVERLQGTFLANGCFMIASPHEREVEGFFSYWQVKYQKMRIMLIN